MEDVKPMYIGAREASVLLGCSISSAYNVIKKVNQRIEQRGGIVAVKGKTNRKLFFEAVALESVTNG